MDSEALNAFYTFRIGAQNWLCPKPVARHLSAPCPAVPRVCLRSSFGYAAGTGNASIRRTMVPNSRPGRWPSASSSQ